jgi:hypothetical protein
MARTVALWAGPRNGSTATMYSFAERSDTRVLDEPLFGHFLRHTGVDRPSRDEVLRTMPTSKSEALATLKPGPSDDVLFLKHMANHLEGLNWNDVDGPDHRHVILTRHPDGVLPSYRAHIQHPTLLDLGYAHQHRILQLSQGHATVVAAESLFAHPEATLRALCAALDLPWQPGMLTWKKGGRPEDGVWAQYWYDGVHRSTGWEPRLLAHGEVPKELSDLRETCLDHYLALESHALTL